MIFIHHILSVAQLFVSSRVKAEKGSQKLADLGNASRTVNKRTAELVGIVKNGQQTLAEERKHFKLYKKKDPLIKELLDFSNFSLHETKKEEMESQVRMLELESELTKERYTLLYLLML